MWCSFCTSFDPALHHCLYCFLCIPSILCNSPPMFFAHMSVQQHKSEEPSESCITLTWYTQSSFRKEQETWWVNTAESSSWSMVFKLHFVDMHIRAIAAHMLYCIFLKRKKKKKELKATFCTQILSSAF